ncbi:hypothetical protein WMY93_016733 [Mugilogobius chulae]|uniref:Small ribosomal subunit protein mS26 n=1 Tax=Mugilogobius chulae TaxID=88201 RepID=A0AAW0NLL6_9GOBI
MLLIRLQRVQLEQEEAERKELEATLEREKQQQEFVKIKEEELLRLQEEAKHFITMENLDQRMKKHWTIPRTITLPLIKKDELLNKLFLNELETVKYLDQIHRFGLNNVVRK